MITTAAYSQADKVVFIEEGSGTWCTNCPRGEVYVQELTKRYPGQFVFVSVHMGDPMEIEDYPDAMPFPGIPSGWFDRAVEYPLIPFEELDDDMASRLSVPAPAGISVETEWDESSREVTMHIHADVEENLNGDYRLAAIVLENGITGTASSYDQVNTYSGGSQGEMGGYENLPNPVPASMMAYNNVARHLPGGINGDENSLPDELEAGEKYTYTYTYTVPEEYNEDYIQVAGIMVDIASGQVLNAGRSIYLNGTDNATPFFHSSPVTEAYQGLEYLYNIVTHDPDFDPLTINIKGELPAGLEFTDFGNGFAEIRGTLTDLGTHEIMLELSDDTYTVEQSYVLNVEAAEDDWILIGKEGFTNFDATSLDMKISSEGIPYILASDMNSDIILVYTYDGSSWVQIGENIEGDVFSASITTSQDGAPIVFTGQTIYKLEDGDWVLLGSELTADFIVYPDIIEDINGDIFIVYFDAMESETVSFKLDDDEWVPLSQLTENYTVWNKFELDHNGNPVLIYGTDGQNIAYTQASVLKNDSWELLGSGYIEPAEMTYFYHDIAFTPDGEAYAALTIGTDEKMLNIYKLENNEWSLFAENITDGTTEYCNLHVGLDGKLIVAFGDGNKSNKVSALAYDGEVWDYLGIPGFSGVSSVVLMDTDEEGVPWVAYKDSDKNGRVTVKKYEDFSTSSHNPVTITKDIKLYPNPTSDEFILEYKNGKSYQIYDMDGKAVQNGKLDTFGDRQSTHTQKIDIKNLNSGFYIIKVQGKSSAQSLKFLKF